MSRDKAAPRRPAAGASAASARSLWGSHFDADPAAAMAEINPSVGFDKRLYAEDIAGSRAHCRMLVAQGILSAADGAAILEGLDTVEAEIEAGTMAFDPALEDVHLNVEARLTALIGEAGKRLHTARSRNDQVATDFRMWVRGTLDALDAALRDYQAALLDRAAEHADAAMPGFTHLQPAQPVTLGHHLMAYVEMAGRDRGRFRDARARLNECPLGAAALAGASFPIDRAMTAAELGFDRPMANSIDAVSDRDFALEALAAAAIAAGHLSRLAEELTIWSSAGFRLAALPEEFTTGSSIMPQKRNPDAAELVRAKAGRVTGALVSLLTVMKGLPLAYSKDMQEDKEPAFDALDTLGLCVRAMTGMVRGMTVDTERMAALAGSGHATATDLADWLARALGMPFRDAHRATGRLVRRAERAGCALAALPAEEFRAEEPRITDEAIAGLSVTRSIASRKSEGGAAPERVREAIAAARARYLA